MKYTDYMLGEDVFLYVLGGISLLILLVFYINRGRNFKRFHPKIGLKNEEKVFFASPFIKYRSYITVLGKKRLLNEVYANIFISNLRISWRRSRAFLGRQGYWFREAGMDKGFLITNVRYEDDTLSFTYKDVLAEKDIEYIFKEDVPELRRLVTKLNKK